MKTVREFREVACGMLVRMNEKVEKLGQPPMPVDSTLDEIFPESTLDDLATEEEFEIATQFLSNFESVLDTVLSGIERVQAVADKSEPRKYTNADLVAESRKMCQRLQDKIDAIPGEKMDLDIEQIIQDSIKESGLAVDEEITEQRFKELMFDLVRIEREISAVIELVGTLMAARG